MPAHSSHEKKKSREELIVENQRLRDTLSELQTAKTIPAETSAEKSIFELFFDNAPFGIALLDGIGNYKIINQTFVQMFGYTSADLHHWWDWFVRAFPDSEYRESVIRFCTSCLSSDSKDELNPCKYWIRCRDGQRKRILIRLIPLPNGDRFLIFEDITTLEKEQADLELSKENEQRFKAVFDATTDCIFLKDLDQKYVLANSASEKFFDWNVDQIMGLCDSDLFDGNTALTNREVDTKVLSGQMFEEEQIKSVNGRETIFNLVKVPIRDSNGHITGLCGMARDITHIKQLESRLTQAQKMEVVGTLAGGIAHDFNNLLTGIIGYGELAMNQVQANSPLQHQVKGILGAAERGRDLTTQILDFSRKADISFVRVDLNGIIKRTQSLLMHTIPKMVVIDLDLEEQLASIQGDATQLEQIIMNLVTNAADAMPDGGHLLISTQNASIPEMTCSACGQVFSGGCVRLTVTDTGHGIDQETLEHIFEPFFTTKKIGKGTGLGLATAFGIVRRHGGHIVCKSQLHIGTTFQIFFPAMNDGCESQESDPLELTEYQGDGETILVVDDEEAIRDVLAQLLELYNYQTITASSGEAGLDIYREKRSIISLVLLDLSMPGMGGLKCLKALRSIEPSAKVIVLSGYSQDSKLKDSVAAGAIGYVVKPFKKDELLPVIKQILT